ncbi:MAG: ATP-dependent DNA helicase UvrD2 [Actinobacteria bacterium]|nr:ATP-dependent DNA helicase UvrD2 [Actinomycetota bacterium]
MPPPPAATPATAFPGPPVLGRGAVVRAGQPAPAGLGDAPRVVVDDDVLAQPDAAAAVLHDHWVHRRPVVIELAVDNDAMRAPETCDRPPYELTPDFAFARERLHHLVWANTYDCRSGEPMSGSAAGEPAPIWWHGVLAERRGAGPSTDADVRLPDGTDVWVDGGPRGPLPVATVHRESVALGRLTPYGDAPPRDDLAPDQLAAVMHASGPARVIAPAGSGKTRVLTARLRHLLRDRRYEPELVTAVAYNTRAAGEMRERVVASGVTNANVRTLHSLAFWICGLESRRDVLSERDVRGILDRLVTTGRIPNQDPFQPYLEALSEIRLALRDPEAVEAERDDVDGLAEMFPRFREELARRNALDFDEQIYRALELLLTRPDIRREVQRRCTHLLVDEFQDLTPAFMLLVRLAAGPSLQVFGVGDDDQVIYSYAGATPDYLIEFDRYFPGASHHALEVNYRCPPDVVTSAVTLLGHNRRRVPKVIHAGPGRDADGDSRPPEVHAVAPGAMSERTVAIVEDWLEDGLAPRDVAILARVNAALLPIQVALSNAGVPRTSPLDASVLGRTGIRTALAYLRLGLDPERIRRDDIWETINRPARKVKSAVEPFLKRDASWSLDRLHGVAEMLDGRAAERFGEYLADLTKLTVAITDGADTERCLWIVRNRIGLGEAMDALDSSTTRPEGSSHGDDLDALEQLAALHTDPVTFREWLVDALRLPGDEDGVHLSTIHKVKGMEWDRVVVFAANQGLMPHRLADDQEEERRVFHVALTRCRDEVAVVGNRDALSPYARELTTPSDRTPRDRAKATVVPDVIRPTTRADGRVVAEPGVAVTLPGGFDGRVTAVDGEVAVVRLDAGPEVRVALGAPLRVGGERTSLARPPRVTNVATGRLLAGDDAPEDGPEVDARFERLRDWRTRTAQDQGMPPYIVLHDAHLREIARRQPRNVRELAGCPGIGPTKLEKYADDILAIVDA